MLRRAVVVLALVLGACGSEDPSSDSVPVSTPVPTVPGVGRLPDTIPTPDVAASNADTGVSVSVAVTRPVDEDGVVLDTVAEQVNGNRLIVVGDSILASTATRFGGEMCEGLNPLGWSVEVNAEPGRFVEFGNEVLESRLPDNEGDEGDFDAAVVHLGTNYRLDRDDYLEKLNEILYRIAPRPTLLLTVTEYRPAWSDVNQTIEDISRLYDNVTVIDWEKIARTPGVLSRDGLHPGNQGEAVLIELLAVALGEVGEADGECLRSAFTDDSAIGQGSGPSGGGSASGSSSGGSSSSGSSGGSSSGSSSGGSSSGSTSTGGSASGSTSGGTSGTTSSGSTTGAWTGGDATGGDTGGDTTGGDTGGDATGGDTGGDTTGGDATGGDSGGDATGGSTGGDATGGDATGGDTGGDTTGGDATGGSTGGDTTGGTTGDATGGTSGGTTGGSSGTTGGTTGTTSSGSTTGTTGTGGATSGGTTGTSGGTTGTSGGSTGTSSSTSTSGGDAGTSGTTTGTDGSSEG